MALPSTPLTQDQLIAIHSLPDTMLNGFIRDLLKGVHKYTPEWELAVIQKFEDREKFDDIDDSVREALAPGSALRQYVEGGGEKTLAQRLSSPMVILGAIGSVVVRKMMPQQSILVQLAPVVLGVASTFIPAKK